MALVTRCHGGLGDDAALIIHKYLHFYIFSCIHSDIGSSLSSSCYVVSLLRVDRDLNAGWDVLEAALSFKETHPGVLVLELEPEYLLFPGPGTGSSLMTLSQPPYINCPLTGRNWRRDAVTPPRCDCGEIPARASPLTFCATWYFVLRSSEEEREKQLFLAPQHKENSRRHTRAVVLKFFGERT